MVARGRLVRGTCSARRGDSSSSWVTVHDLEHFLKFESWITWECWLTLSQSGFEYEALEFNSQGSGYMYMSWVLTITYYQRCRDIYTP